MCIRDRLVGEGHRFFDLLRNGKTIVRKGGYHLPSVDEAVSYTHLYTIAYRFLKSEEEAEDAVQYLFMKLWEQRETFSFESGIRSLLFTI